MDKILVTGGSGFIGSHLCERLNEMGYDVTIYDIKKPQTKDIRYIQGDIRDYGLLKHSMKGCSIVCHHAAMLGVVACLNDKDTVYDINHHGTENVIKACLENGVSNVVFASSSEVYGEGSINQKLIETIDLKPKSHYGISKILGENVIREFHERFNMKASVLRYCNVYGKRQREDFVIPIFIRSALKKDFLKVCGDGRQVRSFTYISDAVEATIRAIFRNGNTFEVYNVASDKPYTIKELALKVINIHGSGEMRHVDFEGVGRKTECEVFTRIPSIEKARKELGYIPCTGIDDGLTLTFNYYRNLKI
ncbi:MAG: NAD-dependent epimerase/dehydratase family protein [Bacillota bacterium]